MKRAKSVGDSNEVAAKKVRRLEPASAQLIDIVPDEVWTSIFKALEHCHKRPDFSEQVQCAGREWLLVGCVCTKWQRLSEKLFAGRRVWQEWRLDDAVLAKLKHFTSIDLAENSVATSRGVSKLTNLQYLKSSPALTSAAFRPLTNLVSLDISNSMIALDINHLHGLTHLVCNSFVGSDTLDKLTSLRSLKVRVRKEVMAGGLRICGARPRFQDSSVSRLTSLTHLSLVYNSGVTDSCLRQLTNLQSLEIIDLPLPARRITDEGISALTKLTSLTIIYNYSVSRRSFNLLTNLASLDVTANNCITNDYLVNLTNITHLNLTFNNRITDAGISHIVNLTRLELPDNDTISEDCLLSFRCLTSLNLSRNRTIRRACLSRLLNLVELQLIANDHIDDLSLSELTNLTSLDLSFNEKITDTSLILLTNLTTLNLSENRLITDLGLAGLTNLTELHLTANEVITEASLLCLTNLVRLDISRIATGRISENRLVGSLPKLTSLSRSRMLVL